MIVKQLKDILKSLRGVDECPVMIRYVDALGTTQTVDLEEVTQEIVHGAEAPKQSVVLSASL